MLSRLIDCVDKRVMSRFKLYTCYRQALTGFTLNLHLYKLISQHTQDASFITTQLNPTLPGCNTQAGVSPEAFHLPDQGGFPVGDDLLGENLSAERLLSEKKYVSVTMNANRKMLIVVATTFSLQ